MRRTSGDDTTPAGGALETAERALARPSFQTALCHPFPSAPRALPMPDPAAPPDHLEGRDAAASEWAPPATGTTDAPSARAGQAGPPTTAHEANLSGLPDLTGLDDGRPFGTLRAGTTTDDLADPLRVHPTTNDQRLTTNDDVEVSGFALARMHADVTGPEDAPPLVVLHGWGSSAWMMRPVAAALSDRFRVHVLDLPGHGRTAPPPRAWGVPDYAALVAAYMEAHGMSGAPVPAVGHSNGGRILLTMASDDATARLFSALVLVSPSGLRRAPTASVRLRRGISKTLRAPFDLLPNGSLKDACLDWLRHSLVWKALGSSDYNALAPTMRETFVRTVGHFVEDRLGRIRIPVLVFWGDRDRDIVRDQMDRLVAAVPDAGLVVMEGAGHYGYLDRMDVFEAATRHFLLGPAPGHGEREDGESGMGS